MKRFSYVVMGIVLSMCLFGCGGDRGSISNVSEERQEEEERREEPEAEEKPEVKKESEEAAEVEEESEAEEELEAKEESEDEKESKEVESLDGYAEGRIGDTMKTYFFNYKVNSAYLCEEYNGYQPAEGKCMLVAEVTVKNTYNESIEMYDTDFQIQWNSDGDDDYDYPITANADPVSDEQLEETYTLGIDEERTGLLVFEVPTGENDFSISYLELFDDDSEGDVYFVFFTPKMQ
ncbi:DUF4352 domain-containing protein [Lachnospiraceae bacterium]|nr:DUF4352 domain-containing protein [Lachnospiraceae bacterium]